MTQSIENQDCIDMKSIKMYGILLNVNIPNRLIDNQCERDRNRNRNRNEDESFITIAQILIQCAVAYIR